METALIIGVLNPRGGSGKTTLATNMVHGLQLEGGSVLLVDTDPQGTATDWQGARVRRRARLYPSQARRP